MDKYTLLAAALFASIASYADTKPEIFLPKPGSEYIINALSDNGRYGISTSIGDTDTDNPKPAGGSIIDLDTRVITDISAPSGWAGANDVADNGLVVGEASGRPAYWSLGTNAWTTFDVPSTKGGGALLAVTPDAKYAVGYLRDANDEFQASPLYYDLTAGISIPITNLPKHDLSGNDQHQNVFYGVSPDGRYVLGQMSQSYMMPVSMFSYIYDMKTQTWKPIGYTYDSASGKFTKKDENLHFVMNQFMSPDGKWVTGTAYVVIGGSEIDGGVEFRAPYRYNVETEDFELFTSEAYRDVAGNKITSDGTLLCSAPATSVYPTAFVRTGNYLVSFDDILSQVYGMSLQSKIGDNVTGSFECISSDGLTAVMVTNSTCYVVRMPETFASAAAKVDLLGSYTTDIPQGSAISKIGEIKITFNRPIACKNLPSTVQLLRADGTVVRNASTTAVSAANPHQLVVTFRTQTLEPGEKYTVRIPEQYIWIKDDTGVKSRQIDLHYTGRSNNPVSPVRITPADGSAVSQLDSSTQYITITFDADVVTTENATATLYNADDNTAVAELMCSYSGRNAYVFPTSPVMLYMGTNYRIEIPAGIVTDLTGSGASQPITLNYKGAYVRSYEADDMYIFNETCDNYNSFIFWQGENNEPGDVAASWGFTADIPWLITRENETSTNMALTAHSMFATPATSDDWLITPQLFIPDTRTYLAFNAQSYLKDKHDRLKVYVYASDKIYNYFNENLKEQFINGGTLLDDILLSPGATEEGLSNEWTRYTYNLENYSGKNIYIAFVYNNTDQSAVFLDDIQVVRQLDFLVTNTTPSRVVNASQTAVKGIVAVASELQQYKGIELTLRDAEGNVIDIIDDPEAEIAPDDFYPFEFTKKLQLTPGRETAYSIDIKTAECSASYAYTVKNLIFEPQKNVVLEEYTGSDCGNCPLGIQAIENLRALYGARFIPVTLRTYGSDIYSTGITGYSDFLGCAQVGAPSGRINRGDIIMPMYSDGRDYYFSGTGLTNDSGTEPYLWADAMRDQLAIPAEASIHAGVEYNTSTGSISVPVTLCFAIDTDTRSISVFGVVVEDNLPTYQSNYFSNVSHPNLGEWGVGGQFGKSVVAPYFTNDVARFVINGTSYNGTPLQVSSFEAGKDYTETLTATIPDSRITNPANCSVVVMAIDGNTHTVVNAVKVPFYDAGVADTTMPTPTVTVINGTLTVNANDNVTVHVYSISGTLIATASGAHCSANLNGYHGVAIVNIVSAHGSTISKIIVK